MRTVYAAVFLVLFADRSGPGSAALPVAGPNANTESAGVLRNGVLDVSLDAKVATWRPNGDSLPGLTLEAFSEAGKLPSVPGPLIRVPEGTEIRANVHNSLARDTLTLHVPATARGAASEEPGDSVIVPPGETRELRVRVTTPGNYFYRGTTGPPYSDRAGMRGLLAGALIVDTANVSRPHHDRVFVITLAPDSIAADPPNTPGCPVFAINGRSWPRTERIAATVGDTVHWRVINASNDVHPLHLHGFYYRVDALAGSQVRAQGQGAPGRMVVTERMPPFSTMSLTWVPERPGNWLFHCHFQLHLVPDVAPNVQLAGAVVSSPMRVMSDTSNHALTGMAGLVLGVNVAPKPGMRPAADPRGDAERRRLRLGAVQDAGFPDSAPSMRFILEDPRARPTRLEARAGFSPTISLVRGEPVSITVVNTLRERTAVHWHGIELESYYDGVAGFSGSGTHLSPTIAPGDSFVARFTPPRSGTFMYHSHVNEVRQHSAGLIGPLIVRDSADRTVGDEATFFLKGSRDHSAANPLEINGTLNPDTVVLHVGKPARLRFISLAIVNPNATVWLTARRDSALTITRDTLVVRWRPVAKDGADLPESARTMRLARQIISMGETYDFEFVPVEKGNLRVEVRALVGNARLLVRAPIRVE